jgi:hypothetical protein
MAKLVVKDSTIRTFAKDGIDYICITDIAAKRILKNQKMLLKIG